ncbi:MAG: ATP-binding cassette domain-containing protein [Oscillospiraceae bacterium]|nr:ATP-binding cassette domain-containing protein [Oscillospiraceae bacterium]
MSEFLSYAAKGLRNSYDKSVAGKKEAVAALAGAVEYFSGDLDQKETAEYAKELISKVESGIDYLQTNKDSYAYTFNSSLTNAIDKYFFYEENNPKEEARFEKQSAKREALIAKGKTVDWKVVPKNVLDLDELKANIVKVCSDVRERYEEQISAAEPDFSVRAVETVDYLKEKASTVVYVITKDMAKQTAIKLMTEVGIPEPRMRYNQYPFEFSGGMRQRIVIAIALAANPEILICDEPTTALDVTIQAQILELINKLKAERNLSIIFITHDLGVVAQMADEIAVMYAGKIVEQGLSEEVFYDPRHPYTWALLSSMPDLDTKEKLEAIPGTPPNMIYPPEGDAFADRNKYAMEIDFEKQPPMFDVTETHRAATWLLHPDAPKVEMPKIITERIERMKSKLAEGQDGK